MKPYLILLIANICFLQFALGQAGTNPNGNAPKVLTPKEIKENFRTQILNENPNIKSDALKRKVEKRYMDYSINEGIKEAIKKENPNITDAQLEKKAAARKKKIDKDLERLGAGDKLLETQEKNDQLLAELAERRRKMNNMTGSELDQEMQAIMNESTAQFNTSGNTTANATADKLKNDLGNLSNDFVNSVPIQQTFDKIKQYYESGKYLQKLRKMIETAETIGEAALLVGGGVGGWGNRVIDQSVSIGTLEVVLTPVFPFVKIVPRLAVTNNRLKDRETRRMHNKILGNTMMRAAMTNHVDKTLRQVVVDYRLRLQDEYTQNIYDDKRFSASGDRNVLISFLTSTALSRQLDRTKFGITKNKKEYARKFRHSAVPLIIVLRLTEVNYSNIPRGERDMIYRLRRRLMTALGEGGKEIIVEHYPIPIVMAAMTNLVNFNKAKRMSQRRKNLEIITKY